MLYAMQKACYLLYLLFSAVEKNPPNFGIAKNTTKLQIIILEEYEDYFHPAIIVIIATIDIY